MFPRAYAWILLLGLCAVGVIEWTCRDATPAERAATVRANDDLRLRIEARIREGDLREDDAVDLARIETARERAHRDWWLLHAQTGTVLFLALLSVVNGVSALPGAMRSRLGTRARRGVVELAKPEVVFVDPVDLAGKTAHLHERRRAAVDALLAAPELKCGECDTRLPVPVLGRIGRRELFRKPPASRPDFREKLAEGWWSQPAEPLPCPRCGGRKLELA